MGTKLDKTEYRRRSPQPMPHENKGLKLSRNLEGQIYLEHPVASHDLCAPLFLTFILRSK